MEPAQVEIAEQHLRHAISLAVEMHAKPAAAQGYLFLGEIFDIAGRRDEALENLRKAEKMYLEMGVPLTPTGSPASKKHWRDWVRIQAPVMHH